MKKIYIFLAMVLTVAATQARELRFYLGDKEIAEGATESFNEVTTEEIPEIGTTYKIAPEIYLWTDRMSNTISFNVKANEMVMVCCNGGCEMGMDVTKNGLNLESNKKFALDTHYETFVSVEDEFSLPTITMKLSAWDESDSSAKASCTIILNEIGASVTLIEDDQDFLVTSEGIRYNINGEAAVTIYTIGGAAVLNTNVSGNGLLSVDNLEKGIYLYSVAGKNVNKSGKIYID